MSLVRKLRFRKGQPRLKSFGKTQNIEYYRRKKFFTLDLLIILHRTVTSFLTTLRVRVYYCVMLYDGHSTHNPVGPTPTSESGPVMEVKRLCYLILFFLLRSYYSIGWEIIYVLRGGDIGVLEESRRRIVYITYVF